MTTSRTERIADLQNTPTDTSEIIKQVSKEMPIDLSRLPNNATPAEIMAATIDHEDKIWLEVARRMFV